MTAPPLHQQRLPAIVTLWAIAAGVAVAAGADSPLRTLLVLSFLFAAPGLALVPLLRIEGLAGLTLAIGLSLALDALVPTILIYAGVWSPNVTLAILIGLSLLGSAAQFATIRFGERAAAERT